MKQCDSLGEGRMGKKTPETPCATDRSWAHAQGTVAVGIYSQWGCIHVLCLLTQEIQLASGLLSSHLSFFRKRFWQSPTFKGSQCKGSPNIKYCDLLQEKRWYRWPAAVILSLFHVIVVEHMCSESLGAKAHRAIAWILLGCTGSHAWCLILVLGHAVQKEEREHVSQQPPCFWQNAVAAVLVKELNLAAGYDVTWWSFGGDRQTRCLSLTDFIFFQGTCCINHVCYSSTHLCFPSSFVKGEMEAPWRGNLLLSVCALSSLNTNVTCSHNCYTNKNIWGIPFQLEHW